MMRPIRYIVVHNSKTNYGCLDSFNAEAKDKGHSDSGFHYIVNNGFKTYEDFATKNYKSEFDGEIEQGRVDALPGVHLQGFNHNSIAILVIGNFTNAIPTKKQWNSLISLVVDKCKQYNLLVSKVVGHREASTILNNYFTDACPGLQFDLTKFRHEVYIRMDINK